MSNGNRLSIPELEDQIAALQAQLASRRQRAPEVRWYTCTRCGSIYTSIWGCGCPLFPGEKRQAQPQCVTEAPAEGLEYAAHELLRRCDDADDAGLSTLSTKYVREVLHARGVSGSDGQTFRAPSTDGVSCR